MADVQPSTLRIKACFSSHYSLPYFQREYKWESRHFLELIEDIQDAFLLDFDASLGRKAVADYTPYFLGSIITATQKEAKKPLIDGQQRLTSIFTLIVFLQKFSKDINAKSMDLSNFIGSMAFGEVDYTVEFSGTRKKIFDTFLNEERDLEASLIAIGELDDLSDSDMRVVKALNSIKGSLDQEILNNIEYFIDYMMERVLLIDISVDTEAEAHRVFVTMNDRGLRLSPIDLLKGQILSRIRDADDTRECHKIWTDQFSRLKEYDPEEDSIFVRTFFRAKWANTARGKAQGDAPGDFDQIGDAYHRWFEENLDKIGLITADQFAAFVQVEIKSYTKIYEFIRDAEAKLTPGFESIHFNAIRRFGPQSMILMAAIRSADTTSVWKRKISILAGYIDLLLTTRIVEGKRNTYDNTKDFAFQLAKNVRDMNLASLETYIQGEWSKLLPVLESIPNLKYNYAERSDLLFILARIACYLEEQSSDNGESNFGAYWARDKGAKTIDIEHILPFPYASVKTHSVDPFKDEAEFRAARDKIGSLILLPRSRNRSLQDKPYADKLEIYKTENILAKTLTESFYQNNPKIKKFIEDNPELNLICATEFGKLEIAARSTLYLEIAKKVWAVPRENIANP